MYCMEFISIVFYLGLGGWVLRFKKFSVVVFKIVEVKFIVVCMIKGIM